MLTILKKEANASLRRDNLIIPLDINKVRDMHQNGFD